MGQYEYIIHIYYITFKSDYDNKNEKSSTNLVWSMPHVLKNRLIISKPKGFKYLYELITIVKYYISELNGSCLYMITDFMS